MKTKTAAVKPMKAPKPQQKAMKAKKDLSYKRSKSADSIQFGLMTLPGFILLLVFCYIPMTGVVLAFKEHNPTLSIMESEWVGFANFKYFFMTKDFGLLMRNTLGYSMWFLILGNVTNIIFAIMCYNVTSKGALKYYQTTAILPTFMSIVLVSYIVYIFLNPVSGLANQLIRMFGGNGIDWYSDPKYWPAILSIVEVWKGMGYGSLLYYATMVGIDESLFEAAKVDGANKFQQIIHVIIPELSALICLKIIMGIGNALGGDFGLFYQVPRNIPLLRDTTEIFSTWTFKALQEGSTMGRTQAVSLFQSLAGVILIVASNGIIRKIDADKSMF